MKLHFVKYVNSGLIFYRTGASRKKENFQLRIVNCCRYNYT